MTEPLYDDPVVAEIHAIRAKMLAECGGDIRQLMHRVHERHRASGRTIRPAPVLEKTLHRREASASSK